jgi:hypothetical protein
VTDGFTGGALGVGSGTGSTTCFIERDRLTFVEALAMNVAKPREYRPANGDTGYDLGVQLAVPDVEINGTTGITVNAPAEVNGGAYFTLLTRVGPSPDGTVPAGTPYVGTWDAVAGEGRIKMMAWEGHANLPLAAAVSSIQISGVPSSDLGATSAVFEGQGQILDGDSGLAPVSLGGSVVLVGNRNYVIGNPTLTVDSGVLSNVVSGDILVVDSVNTGASEGAVKAGTYLVRHAVDQCLRCRHSRHRGPSRAFSYGSLPRGRGPVAVRLRDPLVARWDGDGGFGPDLPDHHGSGHGDD